MHFYGLTFLLCFLKLSAGKRYIYYIYIYIYIFPTLFTNLTTIIIQINSNGRKNSNMFRKICLHHQVIKTIYLFSYYNGCNIPKRKSISLNSK